MNEGPYRIAVKSSTDPAARLPLGRLGQDAKLSLVEVMTVVFRHKWKSVVVTGLIAAATVAAVSMMKDTYRSEAKLMMRDVVRTISLDPSAQDAVTGEYRPMKDRPTDELAILTSHQLAEDLVNTIGPLAVLPPDSDDQVFAATTPGYIEDEESLHNLAVKTVKLGLESKIEGSVITLAYESSTPESAHDVLDCLVDNYLKRHLEIMAPPVSPEFFSDKAESALAELTKAQADLDALRSEHDLGDIVEQKAAAYRRQSELDAQLADIRVDIVQAEAKVKSLDETLASRSRTIEKGRKTQVNETKRGLQDRLLELKLEEKTMAVKYLDTDRELIAIREQIGVMEEALAAQPADDTEVILEMDETRQVLEQTRASEMALLAAARESEGALVAQLAAADDRVKFLEKRAPEALRLQSEVERLRTDYEDLKDSERRAAMAKNSANVANVSVIESATKPVEPVKSQKLRNLLLGLFLAAFGGIACAFVFEQLDDSMKTSGEAEKKLHLPVLATIAHDKAM